MSTFVFEDHMIDWHTCQICYPIQIKLLLLLLLLLLDDKEPLASYFKKLSLYIRRLILCDVAALTTRATNYNQSQRGRVCMWPHKTHLKIVGMNEDWSYTCKISHKSCDSVIVRSRVTAPLVTLLERFKGTCRPTFILGQMFHHTQSLSYSLTFIH